MKKISLITFIGIILISCIISACGTTNKPKKNVQEESVDIKKEIIGEWHLTKESENVDQGDFYPETDILIFSNNGTWNNKETNTYIISDKSITMDSRWWAHQYTYNISISDGKLMLQYPGAEALFFIKDK
ncbi:MAG: hypothetical protein E7524_03415 [Ruminococcaceae bacterium]|nr:hypothetical protein [Oscillospiraceae bacterium]